MAFAASGYPVARCSGRCSATGRSFADGDRFVAALVERDDAPGLARLDFAQDAWEEGRRPPEPWRLFGTWRGVYRRDEPKRATLLSDAELLDLFNDLEGATEPRQVSFRYILTLLLIRRRLLRPMGSAKGVLRVLAKGAPEGQTPAEVTDPGMDEQGVADAIEQIGAVIGSSEPSPDRGA